MTSRQYKADIHVGLLLVSPPSLRNLLTSSMLRTNKNLLQAHFNRQKDRQTDVICHDVTCSSQPQHFFAAGCVADFAIAVILSCDKHFKNYWKIW